MAAADYNRAYALLRGLQFDEAEAEFRAVTAAEPNNIWAAIHLGELLMMRGAYAEGWPLLERRIHLPEVLGYLVSALGPTLGGMPGWNGQPVAGRLLVIGEQGLGDAVFATRYLPWAAARCGELCYYANLPGLEWILASAVPGIRILPLGSPIPAADAFVLSMSLPAFAGTTVETIPAPPYLIADPALLADWRAYFAGFGGMHLGLCWRGNPVNTRDAERSIPLGRLAAAAARPGMTLHALQLEDTTEERHHCGWTVNDLRERLLRGPSTAAQVAAAMAALDVVVTVDTAATHFAGALNLPALVMMQYTPYWPYGAFSETTPWYPSLKMFRAEQPGVWDAALRRLSDALANRMAGRR
jgi:hypothetical protein